MDNLFLFCQSLPSLDLSSFDASNANSTVGTFAQCYSLISLDLRNFIPSNSKNMHMMFYGCINLKYLKKGMFTCKKNKNLNASNTVIFGNFETYYPYYLHLKY